MDLFNKNATDSEKAFLKNRMRAVFGSNEMLSHGIVKAVLAILFIVGGFSSHISIMGFVFFALSSASTFLMFSKMQGERKYSPIGAKLYSILTFVENWVVKIYLLVYCAFIIVAMFGRSLLGKFTYEAAIAPYQMGFWCIPAVILVLVVIGDVSQYLKYQKRFADNIFDCVDAQLVFYSTEKKYLMKSYIYAFLVFVYNIFKLVCPYWYKMNLLPAKLADYLDSGIIIEKYNAFTFIALLLLCAHFVFSGRLAAKYISILRKLKKKINERTAS